MASSSSNIQIVNGRVVCKVFLLDNSMKTLLIEPTSTAQDVCLAMAEKLGFSDPVDDSLCFSLNECRDGVTIERALKADQEVLPIMEAWDGTEDAKFVFMCKLFTESLMASEDKRVVYMLFIQAVYNIITGTYPCNEDDAIQLAALQFQAKFGGHNPATHRVGFLTNTLVEYIPGPHLASETRSNEEWERLIFHNHAILMTERPMQAYLSLLSQRDYYGSVLFAAKQKFDRSLPRRIFIGISCRGILLLRIPKSFTDSTSMETLASFPLADIFRWAYKPGVNFYFEIKDDEGDDNAIYTFDTAEGQVMSDLLTEYALGLLREMGLNADGSRREKSAPSESSVPQTDGAPTSSASNQEGASQFAHDEQAYKSVGGDAGALATAATRSGENRFDDEKSSATAGGGEAPADPSASTPAAPAPPASSGEALPPNWSKEFDPNSNNYYYFNHVTAESRWEPPNE